MPVPPATAAARLCACCSAGSAFLNLDVSEGGGGGATLHSPSSQTPWEQGKYSVHQYQPEKLSFLLCRCHAVVQVEVWVLSNVFALVPRCVFPALRVRLRCPAGAIITRSGGPTWMHGLWGEAGSSKRGWDCSPLRWLLGHTLCWHHSSC
eukprot:gene7808-biopygen9107